MSFCYHCYDFSAFSRFQFCLWKFFYTSTLARILIYPFLYFFRIVSKRVKHRHLFVYCLSQPVIFLARAENMHETEILLRRAFICLMSYIDTDIFSTQVEIFSRRKVCLEQTFTEGRHLPRYQHLYVWCPEWVQTKFQLATKPVSSAHCNQSTNLYLVKQLTSQEVSCCVERKGGWLWFHIVPWIWL